MFRPALVSLAALAALPVVAQLTPSGVVQLDPLTVFAHPSGADERTAAVWVVQPAGDAVLAARVGDLMLGVPGVHLDQPGGPGGRATLYLRGAEENFATVFLDGVPLNDPTNSRGGAVDLSLLEPALLKQAAVVRGPASVRYGPEALAGVVHFATATDTPAAAYVAAEYGDNHLRRASAAETRRADAGDTVSSLALAAHDEGSLDEGSRLTRRFARYSVTGGERAKWRVVAWHAQHEADGFPDDSGGRDFAALRELEHRKDRQSAVALQSETPLANGTLTFTADAAQFDATVVSPGVAPGVRDPYGIPASTDDTRLRRYRVSTTLERKLGAWRVATGADAQREEGRSEGLLDFGGFAMPTSFSLDRTRVGSFAEASGQLWRFDVVTGARVDRYDDDLTRGTVRLGTLLPLGETTTWRVNAGTGFKPASFYALGNPLVGNPALKPERARTLETGLRQTFAAQRGLIDLTLFESRFKDGIDFDPGPPPQLVNRAGIRSRGAEAAVTWQATRAWSLAGAATFTDARSEPGDVRMRSRPRWRGALTTAWRPQKNLSLRAAFTAVGDVPDTSVPTGDVRLGGWARLDLAAAWKIDARTELSAGLDNAFDRAYAEAAGFPSPGRRWRAGLRASF